MKNNFFINRRTCLKGIGASLALPLLETMGWAEACKATRAPWLHVHASRCHHGPILARKRREFSVVPASGFGVPPSRAQRVPPDEGHLGSWYRSVQWCTPCP
jgi:hypothetical protein